MADENKRESTTNDNVTASGEIQLSETRKGLDIVVTATPTTANQPVASAGDNASGADAPPDYED